MREKLNLRKQGAITKCPSRMLFFVSPLRPGAIPYTLNDNSNSRGVINQLRSLPSMTTGFDGCMFRYYGAFARIEPLVVDTRISYRHEA
jgi:hypothetical protein